MTLELAVAQFNFVVGAGRAAACDDAAKGVVAASPGDKDMMVVAGHQASGAGERWRRGCLQPYGTLGGVLARYMHDGDGIGEIIAAGCERPVVEQDARLIKINEYRGRQAPFGIRVTHRSFGKDWRYPITSKFNETAGAQKP